jgi:1-phosphofructokinase family hexose kinase
MIITFTPNPALDVSGTVSELVPNEKSYVSNEVRYPGGNGINAARIAHRLGAEVLATGFLGGSAGEELSNLLRLESIPQHFIKIQARTRTNVTISLDSSHEQTRLSFPGPKIKRKEFTQLMNFLEYSLPSLLIIGGSLPVGITASSIKKIVRGHAQKGIPVFLDVPGVLLKNVISSKPFFIKPNLTEFQGMTGKKVTKINDVLKEARKLSHLVTLQCISSVEGGALLVTKEHAWFGKIPKIVVRSTVGAGDSMVGAMAHAFVKGDRASSEVLCEKMLRWGLAAACATLSNKGLTMGSRSSIKEFYSRIIIKKID